MGIKFRVWFATIAIFGATFVLGITNWKGFDWPASVRWGVGLPLILAANAIVWMGVRKIGFGATSGEVAELKSDGLYRFSRNLFTAPVNGTYLFGATLPYKVNSSTSAWRRGRLVPNGATEIHGSCTTLVDEVTQPARQHLIAIRDGLGLSDKATNTTRSLGAQIFGSL